VNATWWIDGNAEAPVKVVTVKVVEFTNVWMNGCELSCNITNTKSTELTNMSRRKLLEVL